MKEMAIFLQASRSSRDYNIASEKEGAESESKKDTYTTATQKGNWWDAFVCSVGKGRYIWSDGKCEYKKVINWRR